MVNYLMRKPISLRLTNRKINRLRELGRGQQGTDSIKRTRVGNVDVAEKHISDLARCELVHNFKKRIRKKKNPYSHESVAKTITAQRAWFAFFKAGLPVPEFSKLDLRTRSNNFLSRFMQIIKPKDSQLVDGHVAGSPNPDVFVSIRKKPNKIKELAKDLVTIYDLGFFSRHLDFWHFYIGKNNEWERVILDFESFERIRKEKKKFNNDAGVWIKCCLFDMKRALGENYFIFRNEMLDTIKDPKIKQIIRNLK
jgi:hypothetical protein